MVAGGNHIAVSEIARKQGVDLPDQFGGAESFVEKSEQSAGLMLDGPSADHFLEEIKTGPGGGPDQQVVGQAEGADATGEKKQKQKRKELHRLLDEGAEDGRTPLVMDGELGFPFAQAVDAPDDQGRQGGGHPGADDEEPGGVGPAQGFAAGEEPKLPEGIVAPEKLDEHDAGRRDEDPTEDGEKQGGPRQCDIRFFKVRMSRG